MLSNTAIPTEKSSKKKAAKTAVEKTELEIGARKSKKKQKLENGSAKVEGQADLESNNDLHQEGKAEAKKVSKRKKMTESDDSLENSAGKDTSKYFPHSESKQYCTLFSDTRDAVIGI